MASAIGLRVYFLTLRKKGDSKDQPFNDTTLAVSPSQFMKSFYLSNKTPVQSTELERSWYLEEMASDANRNSKGYIHYGTFGFESNLVDGKTKKKNYRRKTTDVEEIPLFYEFWFPGQKNYAFVVFQSFQARSCIQIVMSKIQDEFEKRNTGFRLNYQKIMPSGGEGGLFSKAPVKSLRLIRRNISGDIADRYIGHTGVEAVDFEIVISARRKSALGNFGQLFGSLKRTDGVVLHDGIEFFEAVADIRFGNRIRRVGVFGGNSDAGVIDITEDIVKGSNGHPTFESISSISDDILKNFEKIISSKKS